MKKMIYLVIVALLLCGCVPTQRDTSKQTTGETQMKADIQPGGVAVEDVFTVEMCYVNQCGGSIYSTALNTDKMAISSVQHLPIHKFESVEELQNFVNVCGDDFVADQSYDEIPSFNTVFANKDADFFEENALLLVAVAANSGSFRYGVDSIYCADGKLSVCVVYTRLPEAATMDLAGWFILVTVPKSMVDSCTEFDAYLQDP